MKKEGGRREHVAIRRFFFSIVVPFSFGIYVNPLLSLETDIVVKLGEQMSYQLSSTTHQGHRHTANLIVGVTSCCCSIPAKCGVAAIRTGQRTPPRFLSSSFPPLLPDHLPLSAWQRVLSFLPPCLRVLLPLSIRNDRRTGGRKEERKHLSQERSTSTRWLHGKVAVNGGGGEVDAE